MRATRIILSLTAALFAVLCIGIALTVPMVVATTPAIFGIALAVVAFLLWPKRGRKDSTA